MSVKNWKNTSFESDCYRTPEYIAFEKECKKEVKNICKKLEAELVSFSPSHFEWSAFVKRGNQHIYISLSDVRFWNWYDDVLIRYATHEKDFRGEANQQTSWDKLETKLMNMFSQRNC